MSADPADPTVALDPDLLAEGLALVRERAAIETDFESAVVRKERRECRNNFQLGLWAQKIAPKKEHGGDRRSGDFNGPAGPLNDLDAYAKAIGLATRTLRWYRDTAVAWAEEAEGIAAGDHEPQVPWSVYREGVSVPNRIVLLAEFVALPLDHHGLEQWQAFVDKKKREVEMKGGATGQRSSSSPSPSSSSSSSSRSRSTSRPVRRPPPTEAEPVLCAYCSEPIGPEEMRTAWPEVVGFTPPRPQGGDRKAGGPNQVVFRQPTGRYFHDRCGQLAKAAGLIPEPPETVGVDVAPTDPKEQAAHVDRLLSNKEILDAYIARPADTAEQERTKARVLAELAKAERAREAAEAQRRKAEADLIRKGEEAARRLRTGTKVDYDALFDRTRGFAVFLAGIEAIADSYPKRQRVLLLRHLRDIHASSGRLIDAFDPKPKREPDPDVIDITERRRGGGEALNA